MIESREKIQISPKYLFLVGLSGSGKSFLAGIFQEYGTHVISVGPFAKELAEKQGFQIDEQRPWSAVEKLLTRNSSLLGEELREATCKSCEELIIIEGAKSDQDLLPISQNFPTMVYVVTAPREIRLERIRRRKKKRKQLQTLDALIERDKREIGYGMIEFMLTADGFIENDRSDQLIQVIRLARILSDFSPNVSKTLRRVIALQPLTLVKQKIAEGA